mmetsp:Transcript_20135/g.55600  ORF Transcript_20135/g.55600 Transcript_20135/m.55600 type:complete len:88 (-) Transcript_20135:1475-1738(-)|eukprot:CAMPEP_0168768052 /NCGR_PEP_ID=MMETSP0725-20121227/1680_1 /TAXON_ID=265536 /ORGANISM="Amphiprora sp., Strain CCMP467" /LENGTH=87 /DNA_ID=CAMNT_0008817403 /DNA_START=94 /DNA_END=357 /DNA_ORIENTATION=+
MTAAVRTLIASHLVVLGAGFYLGKTMDADELATYREAHEGWGAKLRRKAGTVALGTLALGTLVLVVRVVSMGGGATSKRGDPAVAAA